MNLLDADHLDRIERHLAHLTGRIADDVTVPALADALTRFVTAPGKRIRPQLCLWTYQTASPGFSAPGTPDSALGTVLDLACAWELFHAFLLVHDDIIDRAERRRDQAALHRQLAALDSNCPVFGQNLGIVAGDLLFCAAMRVLHEIDLPADVYRRQLRLFSRVACVTGFGQAVDICQSHVPLDQVCERTLLRGYHWKTAAYTFEGPMVSGGLSAGLADNALSAIARFARAVGQAYQLHNDLLDLGRPARDGCDLLEGKRTITLMRGRAAMPATDRIDFDRHFAALPAANGHAVEIAELLRQRLLATDAPAQTRALIDQLLDEARAAAGDVALPPPLAAALDGLLDGMTARYFAPACTPPAASASPS